MKSLKTILENNFKFKINRNTAPNEDDIIDMMIQNNTEIVKNDSIAFPDVESFLNCLDELGIKYETDKNKKYDSGDILWIKFENEFKYSPLPTCSTIICKYARISKPFYEIDGIIIRFGGVSKSTWTVMQGVQTGGYIAIKNYAVEQLKKAFKELKK